MILRIKHWFIGHDWERFVSHSDRTGNWALDQDERMYNAYGFTELNAICRCGVHKRFRFIGNVHLATDSEIEQLRRMAGLK